MSKIVLTVNILYHTCNIHHTYEKLNKIKQRHWVKSINIWRCYSLITLYYWLMQNAHWDTSANSAMSPALQEGLVTDVAAGVLLNALLNTAILSLDATLYPKPLLSWRCQVRNKKLKVFGDEHKSKNLLDINNKLTFF